MAGAIRRRAPGSSVIVAVDRRGGKPKGLDMAGGEADGDNGFLGMDRLREEIGR